MRYYWYTYINRANSCQRVNHLPTMPPQCSWKTWASMKHHQFSQAVRQPAPTPADMGYARSSQWLGQFHWRWWWRTNLPINGSLYDPQSLTFLYFFDSKLTFAENWTQFSTVSAVETYPFLISVGSQTGIKFQLKPNTGHVSVGK